jgi:hypothetical protein
MVVVRTKGGACAGRPGIVDATDSSTVGGLFQQKIINYSKIISSHFSFTYKDFFSIFDIY